MLSIVSKTKISYVNVAYKILSLKTGIIANEKSIYLQTHHVDSMLKRRGNDVSTWNPRGVFVGLPV